MTLSFSALNRIVLVPGSALFLLGWVLFLVSSGSLPEPVAIHWGIAGQADGFISRADYVQVVAAALLIPLALQVLFYVLQQKTPLIRKFTGVVLSIVYWIIFVLMLTSTAAQLGTLEPEQSSLPLAVIVLILIFIPVTLWFTLAFPSIEIGSALVVRLRGLRVLTISLREIQAVETVSMTAWNFGGLGIRASGTTLAFVPNKGEGVVFTLQSGEKIAVRSNNAAEISASALAKLGG